MWSFVRTAVSSAGWGERGSVGLLRLQAKELEHLPKSQRESLMEITQGYHDHFGL